MDIASIHKTFHKTFISAFLNDISDRYNAIGFPLSHPLSPVLPFF